MNNSIIDVEKLQQEIINLKKILLDYRVKQATKQPIKSHEIKKYKKELVRIMSIKHKQIIKNKT